MNPEYFQIKVADNGMINFVLTDAGLWQMALEQAKRLKRENQLIDKSVVIE